MKRTISLLLAMVMLIGLLAGCGGTKEEPKAPESQAPASTAPEKAPEKPVEKEEVKWPNKSVQFIVAATPGGLADTHARIVADYLQKKTGANFAIVNQADGGGIVAYDTVRNAKPDGETLLFHHSNFIINTTTGFYDADPMKDFTVVAALETSGALVIIVPANSPYQTLDDYVNDALARPGEVSFGIQTGGASHFLGAMLGMDKGAEFKFVEVGNQTEKLQALLGGFVDACHVSPSAAKQYVDSGDVRVLATSDTVVDPNFPDFIPAADQGYPSVDYMSRFWVVGPAGMDPELCEAINLAFKDMQDDPNMLEQFAAQAATYTWRNFEDSQSFFVEQYDMHLEIAKSLGLA